MYSVPGWNFGISETTHQLKKGNLTYKARKYIKVFLKLFSQNNINII